MLNVEPYVVLIVESNVELNVVLDIVVNVVINDFELNV